MKIGLHSAPAFSKCHRYTILFWYLTSYTIVKGLEYKAVMTGTLASTVELPPNPDPSSCGNDTITKGHQLPFVDSHPFLGISAIVDDIIIRQNLQRKTGVPVRSGDATFPKAMDNVTVRQGESATLRTSFCSSIGCTALCLQYMIDVNL
ncbi:hypothetical protein STEG23_010794 [Scotinomys teguina]